MDKKERIEVLVSTMENNSRVLVEKMKLDTDAIIIYQLDKVYYNDFVFNDHKIREFSFNERGIGLSRNSALMRSTGDICIMADDDVVYVPGYQSVIQKAYKDYPEADMIIFNVRIHSSDGTITKVKKKGKINYFNSLKYGTVTFSFKKSVIMKKNIYFSLLFGGGAKYSNGEDSIFLWTCLKKGLKIYAIEDVIADVYNYDSSWFKGYNEKFFIDRGALFAALSNKFSTMLIYQFAYRKHKSYNHEISFRKSIQLMKKGKKEFMKSKELNR